MNENNDLRENLKRFRDDLQARIKERISQPSVTDSLQQQNARETEKKSPWTLDIKNDKATYAIMAISALFTSMLGLILGLAPYQTIADGKQSIYFNTDMLHWIIAGLYALAFVAVTEGALLVGKNKYRNREEGNSTQTITMIIMMVLAGISVIGTGYAGGVVAASVLGFLSDFKEIPHSAQEWVVKVIPVLLAIYAFLLIGYSNSSNEEKARRLTEQLKRKQQREHKLQSDLAELEVEEMLLLAQDQAYLKAVERGLLSAADAAAARKAGKTLSQLEYERGQDLNGDGFVSHFKEPVGFSGNGNGRKQNP